MSFNIKPAIGTYYNYIDVNTDKNLRLMMIKYFREKTQKWLKYDFDDIINCFTVSGKTVKKLNNCSKKSHSDSDKKIIANHIYNIVYKKRLIKKVLFKYTKLSDTNWYDLKLNKKHVKKLIKYVIKKKILSP